MVKELVVQHPVLVRLEEASRMLAETASVDEVKKIRNIAEAARVYAQQARLGLEAQNFAAEVKIRAERRAGELLRDMPKHPPGPDRLHRVTDHPPTLDDLGIQKVQSHRWQRLATLTDEEVSDAIQEIHGRGDEITTKALLKRAKQNGHAGGSKQEPKPQIGTYGTIVADPPWRYDNKATRGAAEDHYPTMTVEEIRVLPVADWVGANAHLYLWTTAAFLRDSFSILEAWGFDYKTYLVWVKPQMGMGNYFRKRTELILFGIRGKTPTERDDITDVIDAKRSKHSKKPEQFYELVETQSPRPYLEMFARRRRLGWETWGDEA